MFRVGSGAALTGPLLDLGAHAIARDCLDVVRPMLLRPMLLRGGFCPPLFRPAKLLGYPEAHL